MLSSRAEKIAVTTASITNIPQGSASTFFADQMATYWNMPQRRVMATTNIMPVSSPRVLKSIPRMASSWLRMPRLIIRAAPSRATMARLTQSVMMSA